MSDTTILEGPDGRLYEIPKQTLEAFAVPGERVAELRRRMAEEGGGASAAADANVHANAAPGMPPGHGALPPGHAAGPPPMSFQPGQGVVLNFYFHGPGPVPGGQHPGSHLPFVVGPGPAQASGGTLEAYHMSFDETGIPVNHTDMLWGDYIDKQGNPAVGWHSHDPVTGNAQ